MILVKPLTLNIWEKTIIVSYFIYEIFQTKIETNITYVRTHLMYVLQVIDLKTKELNPTPILSPSEASFLGVECWARGYTHI